MKLFQQTPLAAKFWADGRVDDCPIFDVHGHMGDHNGIYFPLADPAAMADHLARINGRLIFSHHWALMSPEYPNERSVDIVRRFPDRFRAYVAINPNHPANIDRDLKAYHSWQPWAVGLKFLAGYHKIPMDQPPFASALEFANVHSLKCICHTWSEDRCNGPQVMRRVVERYPNITFLMAHCFNSDWEAAAQMALDFPGRVYLDLTSIPGYAGAVELMVQKAGSQCILFGTDLPWFDEYQALGGILGTTLAEEDIRNILYRNAEQLFPEFQRNVV